MAWFALICFVSWIKMQVSHFSEKEELGNVGAQHSNERIPALHFLFPHKVQLRGERSTKFSSQT